MPTAIAKRPSSSRLTKRGSLLPLSQHQHDPRISVSMSMSVTSRFGDLQLHGFDGGGGGGGDLDMIDVDINSEEAEKNKTNRSGSLKVMNSHNKSAADTEEEEEEESIWTDYIDEEEDEMMTLMKHGTRLRNREPRKIKGSHDSMTDISVGWESVHHVDKKGRIDHDDAEDEKPGLNEDKDDSFDSMIILEPPDMTFHPGKDGSARGLGNIFQSFTTLSEPLNGKMAVLRRQENESDVDVKSSTAKRARDEGGYCCDYGPPQTSIATSTAPTYEDDPTSNNYHFEIPSFISRDITSAVTKKPRDATPKTPTSTSKTSPPCTTTPNSTPPTASTTTTSHTTPHTPSDLTWHDSEITGHLLLPSDVQAGDDGTGINGIGFRPTATQAFARSQKRRRQIEEWKRREEREERERRRENRRGGGDAGGGAKVEKGRERRVRRRESKGALRSVGGVGGVRREDVSMEDGDAVAGAGGTVDTPRKSVRFACRVVEVE